VVAGQKTKSGYKRETSNWKDVRSGVPQGSILGPLLFIIFINDIDLGIKNRILKFADDTKIFGKVGTDKEIASLRDDLQRLFDWSESWQMPFNIEKCKIMHIGSKNKQAKYTIEGKELASTDEEKDIKSYFY
jgi:hypothetical protein